MDCLQGILSVIPLQLLAFHLAVLRGYDVSTGFLPFCTRVCYLQIWKRCVGRCWKPVGVACIIAWATGRTRLNGRPGNYRSFLWTKLEGSLVHLAESCAVWVWTCVCFLVQAYSFWRAGRKVKEGNNPQNEVWQAESVCVRHLVLIQTLASTFYHLSTVTTETKGTNSLVLDRGVITIEVYGLFLHRLS